MLELLIFGGSLLGSAICCGVKNHKAMSKPYRYLEDGTPVYLDRTAQEHINGEKVTYHYSYNEKGPNAQLVGTQSGKVYSDKQKMFADRIARENEEKRQEALSEGKLAYVKIFPTHSIPENSSNFFTDVYLTCDCKSERIIGKLTKEKDGYYKYYLTSLKDPVFDAILGKNLEKVEISEDEFKKLDISNGSHATLDYSK